MKTPETIAIEVELPASIPKEEARLMLTLGQAAQAAVYSKRAFIDFLGQEGIPVLDSDPSELATETDW